MNANKLFMMEYVVRIAAAGMFYRLSRNFSENKIKRFTKKMRIKFLTIFDNYIPNPIISKQDEIFNDTQF